MFDLIEIRILVLDIIRLIVIPAIASNKINLLQSSFIFELFASSPHLLQFNQFLLELRILFGEFAFVLEGDAGERTFQLFGLIVLGSTAQGDLEIHHREALGGAQSVTG